MAEASKAPGDESPGGVLTAGKYRGLTFRAARLRHPDYCAWVCRNLHKVQGSGNLSVFAQWLLAPLREQNYTRVYLSVARQQDREAQALGAQWDAERGMWHAAGGHAAALLDRFPVARQLTLAAEDEPESGPVVEIPPAGCEPKSVERCVSRADFEDLRRAVVERVGGACEVCGASGPRALLSVGERWAYAEKAGIRKLANLVALCGECRRAERLFKANSHDAYLAARAHLSRVTRKSDAALDAWLGEAYAAWLRRSGVAWTADLSLLTASGVAWRL